MHISVDATSWQNNRGYGRYARAMLSAMVGLDLDNNHTFFVDSEDVLENFPSGIEIHMVISSRLTTIAAATDSRRSISDMWRMSHALSDPK